MNIRDNIQDFFALLVTSYVGGILLIVVGILAIRLAIKVPEMRYSAFRGDIGGWWAGIALILIGIVVLIAKIIQLMR